MASFEDELAELEQVIARLEEGGLSLEESVDLFENGVRLSKACKARLSAAESRIQALIEPERGGAVRVQDLVVEVDEDDEESDEDELDAE